MPCPSDLPSRQKLPPASRQTTLIPRRVEASRLYAPRTHASRPHTAREPLKLSESARLRCPPTDPTNDLSQSNPVVAPDILTTRAPRQHLGQNNAKCPFNHDNTCYTVQMASQAAFFPQVSGYSSYCSIPIGPVLPSMAADRVNAMLQTSECWPPAQPIALMIQPDVLSI